MTKDPYLILGVSRSASDDEIKKAYRNLSRKYHPDANINNPDRDICEQKFKDVQQAYQMIMDERSKGSYGYDYNPFGNAGQTKYENDDSRYMKAVMNYINSGSYKEALNLLNTIQNRTGTWYYYSAIANAGIGNNVTAKEHIDIACRMEPHNYNFTQMKSRIENGGAWYAGQAGTYGFPGMESTGSCSKMCMYYFICSVCLGGNGVFCCI